MSTLAPTPFDFAGQLLDLVEAAVAGTAGGPIERAYVAAGLPAIDCATIAVSVIGLGEAVTSPSSPVLVAGHRHRMATVNLIGFGITLARDCIPVAGSRGAPPDKDAMTAAAAMVTDDVWAVWNAITEAMSCGELFEGRCSELFMDGASALATSGMTAGFVIQVRTALGGVPRVCET